MKTSLPISCLLLAAALGAHAQGTTFTYQGRLNSSGTPYSGSAEVQPTLWDSASGGAQVAANNPATITVSATNGLLVLPLDFGANFPGANRWLQLDVRTDLGPFTTLAPRQPLTPTPYAIFANTASNLNGTLPVAQLPAGVVTNNATGLTLSGAFTGDGANVTNVNAALLGGLSAEQFWKTSGNTGTTPGLNYLGTLDNQPLDLYVNNQRGFRLAAAGSNSVNVVGGYAGNGVGAGFVGATVVGGGTANYSGYVLPNRANNDFATVVGGAGNTAGGIASTAMGFSNASGDASTAMGSSTASGFYSTAMGYYSTASGDYSFAAGARAHALHRGAFVWADSDGGSFGTDFNSVAADTFNIRARGGIRLDDGSFPTDLYFGANARQMINLFNAQYGIGVQTSTTYLRSNARFSWYKLGVHSDTQNDPGAGGTVLMTLTSAGLTVNGTFVSASDRNRKEAFKPVDARAVLEKVAALPLTEWNYKDDDDRTRHLGPMAQDFKAAFNLGTDDKHIATIDADGVALAAIQGLNEKVEVRSEKAEGRMRQLEDELKRRDAEHKELKQRLDAVEQLLNHPGITKQGSVR